MSTPEAHDDPTREEPAAPPKPAPTLAQHLKWSALMIVIVVLLARVATPLLRWLGFE